MDRVIAGVEHGFASRPSSGLSWQEQDSSGPRNRPTPIRPQSPVASDGPTSSSSTPAQAAPKPAAHSSIGKPPEAPNETSLSGLARGRRSLIAGLVVVGVVVSFAILLSQGASRGQGLFSSGAPTPTVTATATEMITATATDQPLFADSLDTPNSNWIDWGDFYTCQASFVNHVLEFKAGGLTKAHLGKGALFVVGHLRT